MVFWSCLLGRVTPAAEKIRWAVSAIFTGLSVSTTWAAQSKRDTGVAFVRFLSDALKLRLAIWYLATLIDGSGSGTSSLMIGAGGSSSLEARDRDA